jgi:hypothetical protein
LGAAVASHVSRVESGLAFAVAGAWLAAGLAHHYGTGITPLWDGRPARGVGHVAWDLTFHVPALVVAAMGALAAVRAPSDLE